MNKFVVIGLGFAAGMLLANKLATVPVFSSAYELGAGM